MNDYIDRQEAIALWEKDTERGRTEFDQVLMLMPSSDVKPVVHGHWIERYRNGFGNMICECSNCHSNSERRNFCPNCGADMRWR